MSETSASRNEQTERDTRRIPRGAPSSSCVNIPSHSVAVATSLRRLSVLSWKGKNYTACRFLASSAAVAILINLCGCAVLPICRPGVRRSRNSMVVLSGKQRNAANATMLDSDNVLSLKPARIASGLHGDPAMDAEGSGGGMVIATVYGFEEPVESRFIECFETQIAPVLGEAGATLLGYYVTDPAKNTFPQLPVREGEHVFVWFVSFTDEEAHTTYQTALTTNQTWVTSLVPTLQGWFARSEEVLELVPTRRSLVHHRSG
jgi:hypothetical protein